MKALQNRSAFSFSTINAKTPMLSFRSSFQFQLSQFKRPSFQFRLRRLPSTLQKYAKHHLCHYPLNTLGTESNFAPLHARECLARGGERLFYTRGYTNAMRTQRYSDSLIPVTTGSSYKREHLATQPTPV